VFVEFTCLNTCVKQARVLKILGKFQKSGLVAFQLEADKPTLIGNEHAFSMDLFFFDSIDLNESNDYLHATLSTFSFCMTRVQLSLKK